MKKAIFILLLFVHIGHSQISHKNQPFKIKEVTSQHWVAGVQGGGSGTYFTIQLDKKLDKNTILHQVFFQQNKAILYTQDSINFRANFTGKANQRENISSKPVDDGFPKTVKPPFHIQENVAILEYKHKDKVRFLKIKKIKVLESPQYPSARPRD